MISFNTTIASTLIDHERFSLFCIKIKVPVGTLVRNNEGELLADLNKDSEIFVAARGGAGKFC